MKNKEMANVLLKEKIAKDVVRYIHQNENAIINMVNNAIRKEKDAIEIYEAMMFYVEYWKEGGLSHYVYETDYSGDFIAEVLREKGKIDLSTKMNEIFANEYVGKEMAYSFDIGYYHKTYNQDFYHYAKDIVFNIQDKILLKIVKTKIPNVDVLGNDLVYECRYAIDEKTIAFKFHLNSNAFGSYRDVSLGEYIKIGEKYVNMYLKEKEKYDCAYDFVREISKNNKIV